MIIVTTETIPGKDIKEFKGFVRGNSVQSKHIGKDIVAVLRTIVGGEVSEYTDMMTESRQKAIGRMVEDAKEKGANAIICVRIETSAIMANASEILAYGTAVYVE